MARIGDVLVTQDLARSFVDAVAPTRRHETPSKVKFEHEVGDLGGFTIRQDENTWDSGAYGIVAISKAAYAALPPNMRTERIADARDLADFYNNNAPRSTITVQAPTNQSRKF